MRNIGLTGAIPGPLLRRCLGLAFAVLDILRRLLYAEGRVSPNWRSAKLAAYCAVPQLSLSICTLVFLSYHVLSWCGCSFCYALGAVLEEASTPSDWAHVPALPPTRCPQVQSLILVFIASIFTSGWKPSGRGSSRLMRYSRKILRSTAGSAGLVSARNPTPKIPRS